MAVVRCLPAGRLAGPGAIDYHKKRSMAIGCFV